MSNTDVDGPPDSKRFRIDVNTQMSLDTPSVSTSTPLAGEASQDGQSPAAPSSASYRSSNSSCVSESPDSESSSTSTSNLKNLVNNTEIFEMLNKTFGGVFNCEHLMRASPPKSESIPSIPGALAVAQSPAAQLFSDDDWSWHRNPAASIRSGGTNKQTPVWKYFVYNKAENLSRCIVGDCTYMLKGPHTSTLACHLKKHTKEYAEFQKLKAEYSRTKLEQQPKLVDGAIAPNMSSSNNSQNLSPVSSGSSTGMDLSLKKEPPMGVAPIGVGVAPMVQVPNFVTNMMLQMNPLQMMLQTLPTNGVTNHTNGATLGGATKKWKSDEKKQKDLAQKLALAIATTHISPKLVAESHHWREFFELVQPKFLAPTEEQLVQLEGATWQRVKKAMVQHVGGRRVNLLIDNFGGKVTIGVGDMLLAHKLVDNFELHQILVDFQISEEQVNFLVQSGDTIGANNIGAKSIPAFHTLISAKFTNWLETSKILEPLKKSIFTLLLHSLTNGEIGAIPPIEQFSTILDNLVQNREIYQLAPILNGDDWAKINKLHQLVPMFDDTQDATIDTIIPTILQIKSALAEEDEICEDLLHQLAPIFSPIITPSDANFDTIYTQATALNPQLAVILSPELLEVAKKEIGAEISRRAKIGAKNGAKLAMGVDSLLANVMKGADNGEDVVAQYFEEISSATSVESIFSPMLRTFGNPLQAPLSYWKSCAPRCPELAELATELLSVPTRTISGQKVLEHLDSSAHSDDDSEQFETQLLMRFNRNIVAKLFN